MSKLIWDKIGERLAETGVDQGVLYPFVANAYATGVAWNGLTSLNEAPTGGEPNPFYADNQKYLEIMSEEEFAGTIGCYTYPDEFKECIGEKELKTGIIIGQQSRSMFGLCYRTKIVNDTNGSDHGFKIHLVYNAKAGVSARDHTTMNETPELEELSFDFTTTKVAVTGGKPAAHLIIDSTKIAVEDAAKLQTLLDTLYGTDVTTPRLLMPDEVADIFEGAAIEAITLSTIEPEDSDVEIAVDANIMLTFNNKILDETISVLSAEGVVIAASHTFDANGKILTINPNVNLSLNTKYTVVVAGVVDIYGQALVPVTKSFTTVLE